MKNLYLILKKDSNDGDTLNLLKISAQKRKVSVNILYVEHFDFNSSYSLTHNDLLYRIGTDKESSLIEKLLINEPVTSFYSSYKDCIGKLDNVIEATLIHEKNNLPIIKTIYSLTNDKALLKKHMGELQGPPVIIKSVGGQHGVGVMKIESLESLYSVADYLNKQNDNFILRQFIDYKTHARLIVLGNKVISSIEYKRVKNDFRSNVGENLNILNKKFGSKIEDVAIKSVSVLGWEFGGVDILIDKNGNHFITEVNFPCYFPRAQQYSNIDISGQMIDYLINKSEGKINI